MANGDSLSVEEIEELQEEVQDDVIRLIDLDAERAKRETDPHRIDPKSVLGRVLKELEAENLGAPLVSHIIVITATTTDDLGTAIQVDHAGAYDRFGQYGMLMDAIRALQNA